MSAALAGLVQDLAERRIVVVGDVVLDEYLYGRPERLSREAAIPVLAFERRQSIPGGAANPAANISGLGSFAQCVAVVGADSAGQELRETLAARQVDVAGVIITPNRTTTTKTRLLAAVPLTVAQQVARLDRVDRRPLPPAVEEAAIAQLERLIPQADAVLCSDYRIGFLSDRIISAVSELCQRHNTILTVDSQGRFEPYRGATLLKCNSDEAAGWLKLPLHDDADFERGLGQLRAGLDLSAVAVTRGGAGFSLLDATGYHHIPAMPVGEVFDATGAGDTFIAVATLGLAAGLDPLTATRLANAAAALVVRRIGVAVVSATQLYDLLELHDESQ